MPAHVVVDPRGKIAHDTLTNFGPRIGFAYRLRNRTVLRSAAGIVYDNWAAVSQMAQNIEGAWPDIGQLIANNLNQPSTTSATPTISAQDPFAGGGSGLFPAPTPNALPSSVLLKESLAAQLREAILSGKLAPGEKIIERRWAREFGAAQVSVREALNILIAEGFVTKGHGRSARVLRLTDPAIIHTYQVRGALEGLAARIIVEQKLSITDLEAAMVELRRAVETNDVRSVIDRVQRFHVCILAKPGNPFLLENGLRLIVPLYAFTLMRALAKGLDASPWVPQVTNHQRIVDAIRMGNPQLAEQVVIHVTNRFMERYLEVWGN